MRVQAHPVSGDQSLSFRRGTTIYTLWQQVNNNAEIITSSVPLIWAKIQKVGLNKFPVHVAVTVEVIWNSRQTPLGSENLHETAITLLVYAAIFILHKLFS